MNISQEHRREVEGRDPQTGEPIIPPKQRGRKPGYTMPEETRQKIADAQRGRQYSDERRQRMREAWIKRKAQGYQVSDETKEKMSLAKKGRCLSEQHKSALRAAKQKKRQQDYQEAK